MKNRFCLKLYLDSITPCLWCFDLVFYFIFILVFFRPWKWFLITLQFALNYFLICLINIKSNSGHFCSSLIFLSFALVFRLRINFHCAFFIGFSCRFNYGLLLIGGREREGGREELGNKFFFLKFWNLGNNDNVVAGKFPIFCLCIFFFVSIYEFFCYVFFPTGHAHLTKDWRKGKKERPMPWNI